jgi:hypothetical protein
MKFALKKHILKGERKLNTVKNTKPIAIVLLLIMAIAATIVTSMKPVDAYVLNIETHAYAYVNPNPAQVGKEVIVSFRIDKVLVGASITGGTPTGFIVTITDPDGNHQDFGPYTADSTSGAYFFYTPAKAGTYYAQTTFPGQWANSTTIDRWYKPDKRNQ